MKIFARAVQLNLTLIFVLLLSSCAVFDTRSDWGFDFRNDGSSRIWDVSVQYGKTAINRSCSLSCAPGSTQGETKYAQFPEELVVTWYLERGGIPITKTVRIEPFPPEGIDHSIGVYIADRELRLYRIFRRSRADIERTYIQIFPKS
jgi:hypothetical protein